MTAPERSFVAVDLGASSGRVVRGRFGADQFEFEEVRRFKNDLVESAGEGGTTLRWSTRDLFAEIVAALSQVAKSLTADSDARVASVGVDT